MNSFVASFFSPIRSPDVALANCVRRIKTARLIELQKMVDELDVGPREEEPVSAKAKKSGPDFGFGFGLPRFE